MKFLALVLTVSSLATTALKAQDILDRLDQALAVSAFDENARARLSGTLDLEYYHFAQPPPGLIDAKGQDHLFNPRLTLFLDAQFGSKIYFFAQTRIDRHFDPTNQGAQIRLDEYALRFTPWDDGRLSIQAGKFATVFGQWVTRHLSWDNPFVTAPLIYENPLPVEDSSAPYLPFRGRRGMNKSEYVPVIWGPDYASGVSAAGSLGRFDYAAEMKNTALSARPESWDATRVGFSDPTFSARVAYRPNNSWNLGLSASDGAYLRSEAAPTLPPGRDIGDYHETAVAEDVTYEYHHLQFWAEFHETRFELPRLSDGRSFGYFLEAKYKFTPQLFGAVRWNQQFFNTISNGLYDAVEFAPDISRLELAGTYRLNAHTQLKLEYYIEDQQYRGLSHSFAGQVTVRF